MPLLCTYTAGRICVTFSCRQRCAEAAFTPRSEAFLSFLFLNFPLSGARTPFCLLFLDLMHQVH